MSMESSGVGCERARFFASLALDGELSDFERAVLDEHLRGCDACARFAAGARGFTSVLRTAPAEAPQRQAVPRLRVRRLRPAFVAAVAAVVAAVALGSLVGALASRGGGGAAQPSQAASRASFVRQQVLALELGAARPSGPGHGRMIAG
jgi:predicted anti-sigma-YlaC factor YlaD